MSNVATSSGLASPAVTAKPAAAAAPAMAAPAIPFPDDSDDEPDEASDDEPEKILLSGIMVLPHPLISCQSLSLSSPSRSLNILASFSKPSLSPAALKFSISLAR